VQPNPASTADSAPASVGRAGSGAPSPPIAGESTTGSTPIRHRMIEVLRIGLGVVWLANFFFIVYPPNHFFGNFSTVALSFAPVSFGGPAFPDYVAAHPLFFSWVVALTTGYLAIAFTFGLTTRLACFVGSCFSAGLFAIQVGTIFVFPGGTDVGEHPLFILICGILIAGGAGRSLSLDAWIRSAWARNRAAAALRVRRPTPVSARGGIAFSARTLFSYFVAGTLISAGVGLGLTLAFPPQPTPGGASTGPGPTYYVNLTVVLNATNGWPQYVPANFSVPTGLVVFTINDTDSPMNWSQCPCVVSGTQGETELVNGTPTHIVSSANVAHSFNIPQLGLATYSPGGTVVRFTVDLINPGAFLWFCIAPCGAGANPYSSPPMGTVGFMTGTLTIT
jgi:hypothetical protein